MINDLGLACVITADAIHCQKTFEVAMDTGNFFSLKSRPTSEPSTISLKCYAQNPTR